MAFTGFVSLMTGAFFFVLCPMIFLSVACMESVHWLCFFSLCGGGVGAP